MANKEFPLNVVIRAVDRMTTPFRAIQGRVSRFGSAISAKFQAVSNRIGLPVLTAAAGRFGSALGDLSGRIATVTGLIAAMGGAAVAAAFRLVQSFADVGGEINDVSRAIGVSAERLQEWRYAAKQNGVEAELLDNSLSILGKNLGKAFKGKGPAELLAAMKIRLKDANGQFKTTDQLLPEIADGLAKIRNPALRATAAAELFGNGGVKLLPMLLDGSKGLEQYAARARELGIVLSNETIAQADEFGDKMDDAKASLLGVRNVIGTALLPQLTKLTERFTDWLIRIRPRLQAWFENFAAGLPERVDQLVRLFDDLRAKLQPLFKVMGWIVDKFGGANVVIGLVAGAIAVFLVPALYSAATAFYALGVAILTTPVGWIALAVIALVAALVVLYNRSEAVRKIVNYVGASMLMTADLTIKLIDALFDLAAAFFDWSANAIKAVIEFRDRFIANVKGGIDTALSWIRNFASMISGLVPDWVKNMFGGKGSANVNVNGARAGAAPLGAAAAGGRAAAAQNGQVRVAVDLNNLPPGTRVRTEQSGRPAFELNQGYAMGVPG